MTTATALNFIVRIPKWRLAVVLTATLLLHVAVLREAEHGLAFDLPAPMLPIQAELFKLPAPITVHSGAVPRRPAPRAITLPGKAQSTAAPAAPVAAPSTNLPTRSSEANAAATTATDPDLRAAASQPPALAVGEQWAAPPANATVDVAAGVAPANSNSSAQSDAAGDASSPRNAADDAASAPLRAVVVDFPKLGRFSSDVTYLRGWLRFFGTTVIEWRINANEFQARSETHDDHGSEWLIVT